MDSQSECLWPLHQLPPPDIGWSVYQWSVLVREPCPKCSKPW